MKSAEASLTNSEIAELLALAAEDARPPLDRAYRRASRKAFLWPEEASILRHEGRPLSELAGVGPYLEKIIRIWIKSSAVVPARPDIRKGFVTRTEAHSILLAKPDWAPRLKGDLQMHSVWSDGSAFIQEMAEAGGVFSIKHMLVYDNLKFSKFWL